MIVDSMTHEEVYQELERDRQSVARWWAHQLIALQRKAIKCTKFPMKTWFEHTSPRRVKYLLYNVCFDKRMKRSLSGLFAIRRTADGYTVYVSWHPYQHNIYKMVMIPHALKRYAERAGVDKTGTELVKHLMECNFYGNDSTNHKIVGRSVRYNGEQHLSHCVPEGVFLGQIQGDIYVARTFITYDMCTGLQKDEFEQRRDKLCDERGLFDMIELNRLINTYL